MWNLNATETEREKSWLEGNAKPAEDKDATHGNVELFAWYTPAHLNSSDYGIHFDCGRIVSIAQSLGITPLADAVAGTIAMAFWHEMIHAWVEDLCAVAESIDGNPYYRQTQKKYGSYILMEEALANTGARGMH